MRSSTYATSAHVVERRARLGGSSGAARSDSHRSQCPVAEAEKFSPWADLNEDGGYTGRPALSSAQNERSLVRNYGRGNDARLNGNNAVLKCGHLRKTVRGIRYCPRNMCFMEGPAR